MVNEFTKNLKGTICPEFLALAQSTENQINSIVQEYVQKCFDNNIGTCSSDGFLLMMVSAKLSYYRCKLLYDEYRKTGNKFDD